MRAYHDKNGWHIIVQPSSDELNRLIELTADTQRMWPSFSPAWNVVYIADSKHYLFSVPGWQYEDLKQWYEQELHIQADVFEIINVFKWKKQ